MRFISDPLLKCKALILRFTSAQKLSALARATGFVRRTARRITPLGLLCGFLYCLSRRCLSYSNLARAAAEASGFSHQGCAKQSLSERFSERSVLWSEAVLRQVLSQASARCASLSRATKGATLLNAFTDVHLHDSTVLSLPDAFAPVFAGSYSRHRTTAQVRIQTMLSLKDFALQHLSLHAYRSNDQSAAALPLPYLKKGSLLIRDLGYFTLSSLSAIEEAGAFFVSRLKWGVQLFCPRTGRLLSVRSLCERARRAGGLISVSVLLGKKERLAVRLLIAPLSKKIAAERRRKAKADRHSKSNHNAAYLHALGYALMLTNAEEQKLDGAAAMRLAGRSN